MSHFRGLFKNGSIRVSVVVASCSRLLVQTYVRACLPSHAHQRSHNEQLPHGKGCPRVFCHSPHQSNSCTARGFLQPIFVCHSRLLLWLVVCHGWPAVTGYIWGYASQSLSVSLRVCMWPFDNVLNQSMLLYAPLPAPFFPYYHAFFCISASSLHAPS